MTTPGEYHARHSFYIDRAQHLATNYARGTVIPINTPVRVINVRGNNIQIETMGTPVTIVNVPKYTKIRTEQLFERMFSVDPIDLSGVKPDYQAAMRQGLLRLGMTKQEAIMARGYPPAHATPSLDLDRWVYWSARVIKQTIAFENGVVAKGRGVS
jgi:hypothetical protein